VAVPVHPRRSASLAAADLGLGVLLYLQVSPALGLLIALAGVVILCSLGYELAHRGDRLPPGADYLRRSIR